MRDVFVTGVSAYLPETRFGIADAIAAGLYDEVRARTDGFFSLAIEGQLSALEMAVEAASALVTDTDRERIKGLYFSTVHRHGHTLLWSPASYLQRQLHLPRDARVMGVAHGCNGGFIAASIACDLIGNGVAGDHLVVGADRYSGSAFDRWNSDLGTLYGDAASAIRFSDIAGPMRVAFWALESEPELEEMYRQEATSPEGPSDHMIKEAKKAYLDRKGRDQFNILFVGALTRLRARVLDALNLADAPAAFIVYPNVGAGLSAALYEQAFGDLARASMWDYGRSVGHTGTSDQVIGLWRLLEEQKLRTGDRIVLLGAGNGLSLAALVIEIL